MWLLYLAIWLMSIALRAGRVTPVIERSYPLAEVPDAIRHVEQGRARGKVVITI
jgi:NADPH:quinone reductase-like Zn-dependent oxidoreductase